jgi:uncharacterized protein YjgD (DUF1641 family)
MDQAIAELNQKVDALTAQIQFLTEQAEIGQRRRQEIDELRQDLTPVVNEFFRLSVAQLEELDQCVQLENILHLFKKLLRNTCRLEQMLDQFESMFSLVEDAMPLGKDAFLKAIAMLDELERKGYFALASGGMEVMDKVAGNLTADDFRQFSESMPVIIELFKTLSQPEILAFGRRAATAAQQVDESALHTSLPALLGQMNDPQVRKGMAYTLQILKKVSQ